MPTSTSPEGKRAMPVDLRFASWLLDRLATWKFVALVTVVTVVRSGVGLKRGEDFIDLARSFPRPNGGYWSWAVLSPGIAHLVHATTGHRWLLLHLGLVLATFALVGWLLSKRLDTGAKWRAASVWVAVSAMPPVSLQWLGHYDVWMYAGGALAALADRWALIAIGGALIGATNVEQGLPGLVGMGLVLVALDRPSPARAAVVRSGVAIASAVAAHVAIGLFWWVRYRVTVPHRSGAFFENLHDSLVSNLGAGTTGVFAWYGLAWTVVLVALWRVHGDRRALWPALGGLLVVPAVLTLTTLDGTRVFAAIACPAFLAVVAWLGRSERRDDAGLDLMDRLAAGTIALSCIVPTITTIDGQVVAPLRYVVERLF
ncbi:MAG: hypothetical protein U0Q22_15535 [Acidimicrobiales bacterium]